MEKKSRKTRRDTAACKIHPHPRPHLVAGQKVNVEVGTGSIAIRPVRTRRRWTEAELLDGVTPEVAGREIDWGGAVGKEVW